MFEALVFILREHIDDTVCVTRTCETLGNLCYNGTLGLRWLHGVHVRAELPLLWGTAHVCV